MDNEKGFTLIELMVVVSIIGILAAIGFPQFAVYRERAYLTEGLSLARPVIDNIGQYYAHRGLFPADNRAAGVAEAENLKGKYVHSIQVAGGRITIRFNDKAGSRSSGAIILTPSVAEDSPSGIIHWERKDDFKDAS